MSGVGGPQTDTPLQLLRGGVGGGGWMDAEE